MSVFTPVSHEQLEEFLTRYPLGALLSYRGIENGITNTNYWLTTERGRYVLTLYENHQPPAVDYILDLQRHLADHHVACAKPVADLQNGLFSILNRRPAAIVQRLEGDYCRQLTINHCRSIGMEMAKFHLAGRDFQRHRDNPCGAAWRHSMMSKLASLLSDSDRQLLEDEISAYQQLATSKLPSGATHSDLFHDNCLFDGERFSGIIDFDYACDDYLLSDIAISLNDCCIDTNGELIDTLFDAFLEAYQSIRPLLAIERDHLSIMLRLAATRFWLSRLHDRHFPKPGEMTFSKDPAVFRNILLLRRQG